MVVYGITQRTVWRVLAHHNYNNIVFALDEQQTVWTSFAIKSIPQYYLISPDNKIIASEDPGDPSTWKWTLIT